LNRKQKARDEKDNAIRVAKGKGKEVVGAGQGEFIERAKGGEQVGEYAKYPRLWHVMSCCLAAARLLLAHGQVSITTTRVPPFLQFACLLARS
jgi:hypothetical protein